MELGQTLKDFFFNRQITEERAERFARSCETQLRHYLYFCERHLDLAYLFHDRLIQYWINLNLEKQFPEQYKRMSSETQDRLAGLQARITDLYLPELERRGKI